MAGDVCSDDAPADHPPRELVAGQKIGALGARPAPRPVEADPQHRQHVEDEDAQVERRQSHRQSVLVYPTLCAFSTATSRARGDGVKSSLDPWRGRTTQIAFTPSCGPTARTSCASQN